MGVFIGFWDPPVKPGNGSKNRQNRAFSPKCHKNRDLQPLLWRKSVHRHLFADPLAVGPDSDVKMAILAFLTSKSGHFRHFVQKYGQNPFILTGTCSCCKYDQKMVQKPPFLDHFLV